MNSSEREQHLPRVAGGSRLAVDPHFDFQRLRVAQFVSGDDPWAHGIGAVEALALGGSEPPLHLQRLPVAGGEVVEDRIAEDVRRAFSGGDAGAGALRHGSDLELVIHHLAVARPGYGRSRPDDRLSVGDVINGDLAIDLGQFAERAPPSRRGTLRLRPSSSPESPRRPAPTDGYGWRTTCRRASGAARVRERAAQRRRARTRDRPRRLVSQEACAQGRAPDRPNRSGSASTRRARSLRRPEPKRRRDRIREPPPRPLRRSWSRRLHDRSPASRLSSPLVFPHYI